jgi:hypothetical protein
LYFNAPLLSFALQNWTNYNPYTFNKMSEEKNDNLSALENETDGNVNNQSQEMIDAENQDIEIVDETVNARGQNFYSTQ